jgi:hypothetical protein
VEIAARVARTWIDEDTIDQEAVKLAETILKVCGSQGWPCMFHLPLGHVRAKIRMLGAAVPQSSLRSVADLLVTKYLLPCLTRLTS